MRKILFAAFAACFGAASAARAEVVIGVDSSLADATLSLVCSGAPVDEAAVRGSPLVQAQISHNRGIRPAATMDAYIEALRGLSACQAPDPDPFAVSRILENPESYRRKIAALRERQDELAAEVARRLRPYVPAGLDFRGDVVLAVPYFSCGGFAAQSRFFIDVRCLGEDLDSDFLALVLLTTHETYHAVQGRAFYGADDGARLGERGAAMSALFSELLWEGSASHVAPAGELGEGGGPLTRLNRRFAVDNAQRLRANFALLTILFEHVARARDPQAAARAADEIAFSGGTFQEMGYFVGARMAGDIEAAWGAPALVCVMQLPPEQFVLAHDAAASGEALRLGPAAIEAARSVARRRGGADRFEGCRP